MNIRRDVRKSLVHRWLGHLVLLVFVCRSLIPVGFMPDLAGVSRGAFQLVICTGYGWKTVELDANGHKLPAKHSGSHHQPCAFSISAVSDLPIMAITIIPQLIKAVVTRDRIFEMLPPPRAGPRVGSRAPPSLT